MPNGQGDPGALARILGRGPLGALTRFQPEPDPRLAERQTLAQQVMAATREEGVGEGLRTGFFGPRERRPTLSDMQEGASRLREQIEGIQERAAEILPDPLVRSAERLGALVERPEVAIATGMVGPAPLQGARALGPSREAIQQARGIFQRRGFQPGQEIDRAVQSMKNLPQAVANRLMRARAAGFDIEAFHGTIEPLNFGAFKWGSHFGTQRAALQRAETKAQQEFFRRGQFTQGPTVLGEVTIPTGATAIPGRARGTALQPIVERARVFPVRIRGNFLDVPDLGTWAPNMVMTNQTIRNAIRRIDPSGSRIRALNNVVDRWVDANRQMGQLRLRVPRESPEFTRQARQIQAMQDSAEANFRQMLTSWLDQAGFQGFRYINKGEDVGSISYMVFDPKNVRVQWANFAPERLDDADMLATLTAAISAGAAALMEDDLADLR